MGNKIKTRVEFINKFRSIYYYLLRNHKELIDEILPRKLQKLSKQECFSSAKKFTNNVDWFRNEPRYYNAARKNGWLKETRKHFIKLQGKAKYVINLDTGVIYPSGSEACRVLKLSRGMVKYAINVGNTAGGYRWAYCDEKGKVLK